MTTPAPAPEPGWHLNANGQRQWWDGASWGPLDASQPMPALQTSAVLVRSVRLKMKATAYVLAILLGTVGAHRFYLQRYGTGWTMLIATVVTIPFRFSQQPTAAAMGYITLVIVVVWVVVDLFLIPGIVREANRKNGLHSSLRG